MRLLFIACCVLCFLLPPGAGLAQETSRIDAARGPISGSTRLIGLGGAFVAIAEDTAGIAVNPASVAVRLPYSFKRWDYALGFDVAIGSWLPGTDLLNQTAGEDEQLAQSAALFGALGTVVYYRHAGVGLAAEAQHNALEREDAPMGLAPTDLTANFGIANLSLGYGFAEGQIVVGAGPRVTGVNFDAGTDAGDLIGVTGVGYQVGAIFKPHDANYRVGAMAKSAIEPDFSEEQASTSGATSVHVPWELAFGLAYSFGPQTMNPKFVSATALAQQKRAVGTGSEAEISRDELERAEQELLRRYRRRSRRYLLVSSELAIVQPPANSVRLEQFWQGSMGGAVNNALFSPRLGLESEVIAQRLKLRVGSYYEPARTAAGADRLHGTLGFDIKLFSWSVFGLIEPFDSWQLSVAVDGAREYLNTSFSLGIWH